METLDSPLLQGRPQAGTSLRRVSGNLPLKGTDLLKGKIRLPGWEDKPGRHKSPGLVHTYYRVGNPQQPGDPAFVQNSMKKRPSQLMIGKIQVSRQSSIETPAKIPRISIRKSVYQADMLSEAVSIMASAAPSARRDTVASNLACRRSVNVISGFKLNFLPFTRLTHK